MALAGGSSERSPPAAEAPRDEISRAGPDPSFRLSKRRGNPTSPSYFLFHDLECIGDGEGFVMRPLPISASYTSTICKTRTV